MYRNVMFALMVALLAVNISCIKSYPSSAPPAQIYSGGDAFGGAEVSTGLADDPLLAQFLNLDPGGDAGKDSAQQEGTVWRVGKIGNGCPGTFVFKPQTMGDFQVCPGCSPREAFNPGSTRWRRPGPLEVIQNYTSWYLRVPPRSVAYDLNYTFTSNRGYIDEDDQSVKINAGGPVYMYRGYPVQWSLDFCGPEGNAPSHYRSW